MLVSVLTETNTALVTKPQEISWERRSRRSPLVVVADIRVCLVTAEAKLLSGLQSCLIMHHETFHAFTENL